MFQVALGGYFVKSNNLTMGMGAYIYYEPGYNFMSPIEMIVPASDQIYILVRRRLELYDDQFDLLDVSRVTAEVTDITTDEAIPISIETYAGWKYRIGRAYRITANDLEISNYNRGLILTSPANNAYRININGDINLDYLGLKYRATNEPDISFIDKYDIQITDPTKGLVLTSPSGIRWRFTVDETGSALDEASFVRTKIGGFAPTSNDIVTGLLTKDIEITDSTKGLILRKEDNTRWRITTDDDGNLSITELPALLNDPDADNPLVITITNSFNINAPRNRAYILRCFIKDNKITTSIDFRIIVQDTRSLFYYLSASTGNLELRNKFATAGNGVGYVGIANINDTYVILSPHVYFQEINKTNADFSYPLESIYYQRWKTYNDEDFNFAITRYGHANVARNVQLVGLPYYRKAAVLLIDRYLYTQMLGDTRTWSVDITATGALSGVASTFRLFFISQG